MLDMMLICDKRTNFGNPVVPLDDNNIEAVVLGLLSVAVVTLPLVNKLSYCMCDVLLSPITMIADKILGLENENERSF
jgi:hypothetical protein